MTLTEIYRTQGRAGLRIITALSGISDLYLYQIATHVRPGGPKIALRLHATTDVKKWDVRPDLWQKPQFTAAAYRDGER